MGVDRVDRQVAESPSAVVESADSTDRLSPAAVVSPASKMHATSRWKCALRLIWISTIYYI